MKVLDQTSSLFWLLISISVLVESLRLGIGTLRDPGLGFLTFGASGLMGILSLVLFIQACLRKERVKTEDRRSRQEEMGLEYQFDYCKSRPNRFASRMKGGAVAVVLDPDVASVFRSPESVNTLLRSVIRALPKRVKA